MSDSFAYLCTGEDGKVDLVLEVVHDILALLVLSLHALPVEDHGATWSPQRLVRGGHHHIGMLKRRGHDT